jgi:GT2 family glycosyltransferase
MASNPRFSVVITCYNQREFIGAAIDSALSQNYPQKEVIVVDDGSSDGSWEVIQLFANKIRAVRFTTNAGAIAARNRGASEAQGEYLVFLDGDDMLTPWALEVYEQVVAARRPKLILGETFWFHDKVPLAQRRATPEQIDFLEFEDYLHKNRAVGLSASSMVIQRRLFETVGGWTPGIFHLDCQDLCAKLGTSGPMILVLSPHVTFYRVHAANSIHNVAPFLDMAHRLMSKVERGGYPGGSERRYEQYALFGGLFVFWVRRAIRAGLYTKALKLAVSGWKMILAAGAHRFGLRVRHRVPVQSIKMSQAPAPAEKTPAVAVEV